VSLAVHAALLFGGLPLWDTVKEVTLESPPLVARLVEPEPPPIAPAQAEKPQMPPKPAAPKRSPRRETPIIPDEKRATVEPAPAPAAPAPAAAAPAPAAAAPALDPSASAAAPAQPAPAAAAAPPDDTPLLISQYGIRLRSETQRQARYPAMARREGWEGRGELLLVVGEDGRIAELKLVRSSGHTLLDRALIEGVRRAQSRVEVPAGLQGRRFQLELPFVMNLVNE
jgi:protein TonB